MPRHELLDNVTHKNIKVLTHHHPSFGDIASYTHIFNSEFRQAQREYPLFFRKNTETGKFETIALFGFAQEENLYLDNHGWHAHYIPLTIQRRPFLIGFQHDNENGIVTQRPVIHIDMESSRINTTRGKQIFLPKGGESPYLQKISAILDAINQGHAHNNTFVQCLVDYDLIESVNINVTLNNGSNHRLTNLYTIHEEKLAQLHGNALDKLHKTGFLQDAHMIIASMVNLTHLIEKKNATLTNLTEA